MKVLIASVSSRELAWSAVAAGYEVISLDFFGDSGFPEGVEVYSLARDFHAAPRLQELARAVAGLEAHAGAVVIGAGLENEPALLELKVKGKRWYNTIAAVQGVRDMGQVKYALQNLPVKIPERYVPLDKLPTRGERWLVKDLRHSGGVGVAEWDGSTSLEEGQVLERYIPGELVSASFVADGKQALLLGLTRQYAGIAELNARRYAWCGNVISGERGRLWALLEQVANRLAQIFGLVGVNGVDAILQGQVPFLLEVNPRPCGSGELFERSLGVNIFELHVDGCNGKLPSSIPLPVAGVVWGKGILYADQDLEIGETGGWAQDGIVDVPRSGDHIPAGAPVCSILAQGVDAGSCWKQVLAKGKEIYRGIRKLPET
ncbi:MAG: ATP-grasp domain-containing protein [Anaerolineaceae bacterium]|nr:ATP-grasp domain-containing protein [Anaerolineaceae bacterium]